jgi:hypothetical protein
MTSAAVVSVSKSGASTEEQRRVLLWGGLAGIAHAAFVVLTAITFFGFVPPATAGVHGLVMRYPDARTAFAVGETFSLAGGILAVPYVLALFQALRTNALAPALWATGLTLLGQAVLAVEKVPRVVFSRMSELYHAPGATDQDRATLALMWQANQALFDQFDTSALVLILTGAILGGVAMLPNPAFGRKLGLTTIVLASAGITGLYFLGVDSLVYAAFGLTVFIVLPVVLGWKLYRLSQAA